MSEICHLSIRGGMEEGNSNEKTTMLRLCGICGDCVFISEDQSCARAGMESGAGRERYAVGGSLSKGI